MSDVPSQNRTGSSRVGWQGRRRDRDSDTRYRWQLGLASQPTARLERRKRRQRVLLLAFVVGLLGLAAFFLQQTLFLPVETPYLLVVPPAYAYPLAPHAWAAEDRQALTALDGTTLALVGDASAWRTRERGLADLERRLGELADRRWRSEAVVIHISMPGAIKLGASGRPVPCLIPPDASPTDSGTWLPLADVFALIAEQELPAALHKLVILDCSRRLVDWNLGQLYNGFSEALPDAVRQARSDGVENLVVLSACSPGEQSWAGPEIQSSALGRYLQLGLAGAADLRAEQGDHDGVVSLQELHRYLTRRVDGWSQHFRDAPQRPRLIPNNINFNVAWSVSPALLDSLLEQADIIAEAPPSVDRAALVELWQNHDELAAYEPLRYAPLAWSRFEQQLLWLEDASQAGAAYRDAAAKLADELLLWSRTARQRGAEADAEPSLTNFSRVFAADDSQAALPVVARSLPLAELTGGVAQSQSRPLLAAWRQAEARAGDAAALGAVLRTWAGEQGLPDAVEAQMLRLLQKYHVSDTWTTNPEVVRNALNRWAAAERACAGQTPAVASGSVASKTSPPEWSTYVPADLRAHRWVRPDWHAADLRRREAFDLLLAGENAAGPRGLELWDRVGDALSSADATLTRFTLAYQNRDATFARAPYFARWLMRPQPLSRTALDDAQQARDALLPLIEANQKLAGALGHAPAFNEPAMMAGAAFGDDATVGRLLAQLESQFSEHCQQLVVPSELTEDVLAGEPLENLPNLAAQLRDIDAALQLPIIPWDRRDKLWARRRIVASQLRDRFQDSVALVDHTRPSPGDETDKNSDDDDFSGYLEFVADPRRQHPALALLDLDNGRVRSLFDGDGLTSKGGDDQLADGDPESISLAASVARAGQLVRDYLLRLPLDVATYHVDESPDPSSSVAALDQRARAACGFGLTTLPTSPDELVQRHEVQQLLLWQGRRMIDDALGPARPEDAPYFERAAYDCLTAAESVLAPAPAVIHDLHDLHDLLEARRRAMRSGVVTTAADILMTDVLNDLTSRIAVQSGADAAGLPTAEPFVMLRDPTGANGAARIPGTSELVDLAALRADNLREEFTSKLTPDDLLGRGVTLEAVTVLRGNEFAARLLLKVPRGAQVALDRHRYGPPQVAVYGRPRKRPSIEFIVDCSNTMSKLMEVEGPGGAALPRTSRLDVAKVALAGMLARLAREGDARAGVRLFGHRVGRNPRKPEEILRQNGYLQARQIPPVLEPYADVESVLPLGRLDTASAESVNTLMKSVIPFGETPLYLSIVQALREMAGEEDTERNIVVITDGRNNQLDPPPELDPDPDAVLAARGDRPIRLFIVGFGLDAKGTAAEQTAIDEFTGLAEATGGRYFSVSSAQQLIEFIEELLGPSEFTVTDPNERLVATSDVGRPATLPPQTAPRRYVATFDSASAVIDLKGGEAVELESEPSGTRLLSVSRRFASPKIGSLVESSPPPRDGDGPTLSAASANAGRRMRVVVERPIWKEQDMLFPVWFDSDDRRFTPRPAEVWVRITPVLPDERPAQTPYLFYDANFEPGTSAPLLQCAASNWPTGAVQAQIDVWCSYAMTRPTATVELADVAEVAPPTALGFPAPVEGVFYRVRVRRPIDASQPLQLSVVEQHTAGSDGLDALKVECHPAPDRIVHLFDAENRLVVHTFYYNQGTPEPRQLRLTSRTAAQAGALHLRAPLELEIFDNRDTVELSPPGT